MINMALVTFKGFIKDRVFHGIGIVAVLFFFLPTIASLSLRQVRELSTTLSLSLISLILLLLALFLGGVSVWRDLDRRHTYTLLGLPLSRQVYLLGKFCGVALFLSLVVVFLSFLSVMAITLSEGSVPSPYPMDWRVFALAVLFDLLKYLLLVAFAFLFSAVSTSFFLPLFGTIAVYLVGSSSQDAFDFVHTQAGGQLPELVRNAAVGLYYLLPNFTAFDLKLNAIYGVPIDPQGIILTLGYFVVYLGIVLYVAVLMFNRRELM